MAESMLTVANNRPKTVESSTGIQVVRGGSILGAGFFQSIQDAYTNLNQSGFTVIYLGILVFTSIAEISGTTGPLELMKEALDDFIKASTDHTLLIHLASLLSKILNFLITHKVRFISVGWMWFPYFAKSSSKNFWVAVFLSLFGLFSKSLDVAEILLLSNCFFLWAALRSPTHKMVFLVLGVFILIIALDLNFHKKKDEVTSRTATGRKV